MAARINSSNAAHKDCR